ncbi:hypothetical protein XI25_28555 [Paenibacillus sp. DMB20]|nr:hypothetical protein XI25_28555 [Paenibacillus sp. DMB20]
MSQIGQLKNNRGFRRFLASRLVESKPSGWVAFPCPQFAEVATKKQKGRVWGRNITLNSTFFESSEPHNNKKLLLGQPLPVFSWEDEIAILRPEDNVPMEFKMIRNTNIYSYIFHPFIRLKLFFIRPFIRQRIRFRDVRLYHRE